MELPITNCCNVLEKNLRILKKSIRERSVKYKRGSKVILEIRKAASECSYKNMNCYKGEKTDFFCKYIKDITDKIDKVRKMRFVSSTFKNLDEVNKWLEKANAKFKDTKQEEIDLNNLDISYVRCGDSCLDFSDIMKSTVIEKGANPKEIKELAKSVFVVADRLKRACDNYLAGKVDQKIIKDINYVRECSKAVKGLSKGLNKFEENIYCADDGEYIFKLSSEKDKGDIEQIIRTATKPFNSGEDLNRIKKI